MIISPIKSNLKTIICGQKSLRKQAKVLSEFSKRPIILLYVMIKSIHVPSFSNQIAPMPIPWAICAPMPEIKIPSGDLHICRREVLNYPNVPAVFQQYVRAYYCYSSFKRYGLSALIILKGAKTHIHSPLTWLLDRCVVKKATEQTVLP
ncbi:MAG TPA: hypothetical protein PLA02_06780 [Brevefilum fermentans]|jgi:hypothetical protein|uniref:hypothetical protein n=1 Tax=Candidatus Brevifilum fermentans TaxID=1986204 RepID=UPI0012FF5B38|nr:hypothetical protein [Brevefilum fermentans]MDI9566742.1 hypothetical protein [Chloroflexota bacterium]HOM67880.1 hypothetical protein [Brevefilum fermentans]HPX95971.1 hypothetical protein [Brevefilum fermentans]HQA28910.1 hypothetical protein [Brevefilum fermentans]